MSGKARLFLLLLLVVLVIGVYLFFFGGKASGVSLGREIFSTGQDPQKSISYQIQNQGMMMAPNMMAQVSCADCHMPNGTGGMPFPNGVTSANLTVLTAKNQNPPYTFALFKRAVTQGIDNQGKRLQSPMPQWSMSEQDLRALWSYVSTLQKQ